MKRRIGMQLILATALALTAIAVTVPTMPTWLALAGQIRSYGVDGRDGVNGRDGRTGRDGRSQSIRADGTPMQVEAGGEPGQDGEDGARGNRPSCPAQPRNVRYDLQAPDGGDGGDGGNGGAGGQGGRITLYYTDPAQLRQVLVEATGGQTGRAGRGGPGTPGCRCVDRSWQVRVCRDGTCETERYRCWDGDHGRDGRDGRDGMPGELGQVWLVNREAPLPAEQPTLTQPLEAFLRQPVALSKHLWDPRQGAGALLAAGSTVADTYYEYVGRVEAEAQIVWQAQRSPTPFLTLSPTASLTDTGSLQLDFPDTYWIAGQTRQDGPLTTYTIDHIVRADEVTELAWGVQSGQGSDFAVTVIDLAGESAFVNTEFELVYRTSNDDPRNNRRMRYQEQFAGPLPAAVITQDQNRFVLNLGQLPISDRHFRPGTQAQVQLRIVRSLGQNSAEQTLAWQGAL